MNIPLKENERLDDLQNGYYIIQNTRDFCYGIIFNGIKVWILRWP